MITEFDPFPQEIILPAQAFVQPAAPRTEGSVATSSASHAYVITIIYAYTLDVCVLYIYIYIYIILDVIELRQIATNSYIYN